MNCTYYFQGPPGISLEGQKGEPGDPGYASAPLRSNYITNYLSDNMIIILSLCMRFVF